MTLEEFRLESYDERMVLVIALAKYKYILDDNEPLMKALEALQKRLSDTLCQPGGCSICNPKENRYD